MNLPQKFIEKMEFILGNEFPEYMKSFEEKRVYGIRINSLKINSKEFFDKEVFETEQVSWCKEGFYYNEDIRPAKHPYYHAGLYYLQEPSAMAPAAVFEINEGDKVLDICAAPGGKSTHLGAKLNGTGILIANDISAGRTKALLKNIELFGIKNAVIMSEKPNKLVSRFSGYFDKILIDAPCSGEGMFRKEPDIIKSWGEEMSEFCCEQQKDILENCAEMLCYGGYILYSTCTFAPEENENIINKFVNANEDFEICDISKTFGFSSGRPDLIEGGTDKLKGCARLFPHKIKGEGHFLALLRKKDRDIKKLDFVPSKGIEEKDINSFLDFKEKVLDIKLDGIYQMFGEDLYLLPYGVPDLKGMRVIRSGWHLGKIKKNRFEPSQAFAMGLKKEDIKKKINFSLDDEKVIRYLKGETLAIENIEDGWYVVLVDGFPLGWGRMQNERLKNKYYPGWKWE